MPVLNTTSPAISEGYPKPMPSKTLLSSSINLAVYPVKLCCRVGIFETLTN
jgi:hypothetical protein